METIKHVLCFLNELDFVDKLDSDCLEKLLDVKMRVREFHDNKIFKIIYALNIIDEIKLSNVTNGLGHRLEKTDSLRSVNFYSFSFKHLVDTNKKQQDKQ